MWKLIWPYFIPKTKQDDSQVFYLLFSIWTLLLSTQKQIHILVWSLLCGAN